MIEIPTVIAALSAVMADVQSVRKDSRNASQGFNFRGIDAVMNSVGPALRQHGVVIVPETVDITHRDAQTTGGKAAREATVVVTYRAYGPAGDSITIQAPGESLDSGDKATPKAMSVAYRTALLQALTIPTDDPEPDAQTYERAARPRPVKPEAPQHDPNTNPAETGELINPAQMRKLHATLGDLGLRDRDEALQKISGIIGHPLASTKDLTKVEANQAITFLANLVALIPVSQGDPS